ncbi:MAG: hypothetical protein ITG00_05505 [Flavobacterium sp.]|nr:hypothetical protein [Flavobacterium sp.]
MRIIADGRVAINSVAPFAGDQFSVFGTGSAVNGYTTGANGIGVYGQSTGASGSIGMYGTASGTNAVGQFGVSNNVSGFGVRARNTNAAGTGVLGAGNNIVGTYLIDGTGGSFNGITTALFAYYTTPNVGSGIVIQDAFYQQWDLGAWDGMYYKIIGTGTVSTVVNDLNNDKVVMQCTETPEGLFQDHGIGQLTNGKAHITIDPIFSKNIKVSDEFPLKVFVQLEGECNGVYVTNKSATSFDVVELQGGNSNVKFAYSIVANRADENFVSENGDIRSSVYSTRFKQAPKIRERATLKDEEVSK